MDLVRFYLKKLSDDLKDERLSRISDELKHDDISSDLFKVNPENGSFKEMSKNAKNIAKPT